MDKERLEEPIQVHCNHENQGFYTERCFDILNGLELVFTRCISCHKIVCLEAKKFASP